MIYTVNHNSPPRYLLQGAEEDSEEIDYKEMRQLKTSALAEAVLKAPEEYTFELEIRFKNPYSVNEVHVQTVKASQFQVHHDRITCLFQQTKDHPLFFSWNHRGHYSASSLYVTGPHTLNHKKRVSHFAQYVESPLNPSFNTASLDTHLRANLVKPDEQAIQKIKPKAARKLLFDDTSNPPLVDAYKKEGQLKIGAILQVEKAQADIMLT